MWQDWSSVKAGQPEPPVVRGEGTCRGMAGDPAAGWDALSSPP